MTGILGTKIGMTRVILEDGTMVPVTVIECKSNLVTGIKTPEKDGYSAMVLGFGPLKKPSKTKKFRHLREIALADNEVGSIKAGDEISTQILDGSKTVTLIGVSKGKGFQGVIKRHNFSSGPESHGSHHHREPGSIGQRAKPGRVNKGKRLPGRMGCEQRTLKKVEIVKIDHQNALVAVKGPVPGAPGGLVVIKRS